MGCNNLNYVVVFVVVVVVVFILEIASPSGVPGFHSAAG